MRSFHSCAVPSRERSLTLPPPPPRRLLRDTSSIQRGIIRHVYLVIDLSSAMLVRDYKATWLDLTVQYAQVRPPPPQPPPPLAGR